MNIDEFYVQRCLQLAANGIGNVSPNPMVGAVIVCDGKIIGEGYHRAYGQAHAEVNAINNVRDKHLLERSTIYVSLEPCSHYGKTPPCSQLIIDSKIPKVVIGTLDPYFEVSGRGVKMLTAAGIDVQIGVLEEDCRELNKYFFTYQEYKRPYVILKWAQTKDRFIDRLRVQGGDVPPARISNEKSRILVHKIRSEVSAIMVGTNTAILDNPSLTTRFWSGNNPIRIVLDRDLRIPHDYQLFDGSVETIVFTEKDLDAMHIVKPKLAFIKVSFDENLIGSILTELYNRQINSVLVEGGTFLLESFIRNKAWDEAYIETADIVFGEGVKAPFIDGFLLKNEENGSSKSCCLKNIEKYKIL